MADISDSDEDADKQDVGKQDDEKPDVEVFIRYLHRNFKYHFTMLKSCGLQVYITLTKSRHSFKQ